ncbi:nucleotide sugar dehydrogenase [Litoribacter alkaliphilus]|uniref:Nucleotide sugar dehydrogenase n=1 Tax=Litoribacter ruber TaxID=702568 RepID=A0AAP2CJG9_9BACT|nr:nucleotide sugar dehydrogenase [Litoribacter alkaliphilus]MBS9524834.1 nucleotide sugar dehydrogenase [Litoribacter alkaliphilus]
MLSINEIKDQGIAVIGLGYVGLPLAVEFAKKFKVVGFDINEGRIAELSNGHDRTLEVEDDYLKEVLDMGNLSFTNKSEDIASCSVFIITVPTPVDKHNRPDLTPLVKASQTVGKVLKKGDIVIYESTVYPGCTEEDCVPVLEEVSGLKFNTDFYAGYSPERINPGDKEHTVTKIKKVTAGSTPESGKVINDLYGEIIVAGTHLAPAIKVAEAAKVIENSQRDINIAFVNELSKIFAKLDIDTLDVLEAAGTKWNFLPFRPGLVGGHCIGVDPFYLAQKAMEVGYNPEIILGGRRVNDSMGKFVADQVIKLLIKNEHMIAKSSVLMLGVTFKENCPDVRNTRVIDVIQEMKAFGVTVDVYDPWADKDEVKHEYGLDLIDNPFESGKKYEGVVLAVSHKEFLSSDLSQLKAEKGVIYDVKSILPKEEIDARL